MGAGLVTQQNFEGWTVTGMREYLLVVYPDEAVQDRILAEKERFCNKYGMEEVAKMVSYIKVTSFSAMEVMEATLLRWIQRICSRFNGFNVLLNNYSGFPTHSIYLRVQNQQPFLQLTQQLKVIHEYVNASAWPGTRQGQRPHLTIAGQLNESLYQLAMPAYSRKTFKASFPVNELVLLARDHPFAAWKTITVFGLLPNTQKTINEVA